MIKAVFLSRMEKILESLGGEKRIDYSLERFTNALESLGNPEKSVKSLIVSGTNGKGTCSLLISSALKEAGHGVGTYLSPHLQSINERFLHNLVPVDLARLDLLAEKYEATARTFQLTYFEYLTLLYFVWAKEERLDFSVLECGLGGRLDATNVTDPVASLVTSIGFDHQAYLGNDLKSILKEKLGVLRHESLLFTSVTDPELLKIVDETCLELDAIQYYSKEIRTEVLKVTPEGQEITFNGYPFRLTNPSVGTVSNAALSFLALRIAFPIIPMETLQRAFAKVRTPGRMEIVQENPRVILSGDHNLQGIECLAASLEKMGAKRPKIVCAFSPDKPYAEMHRRLSEIGDITLTVVSRLRANLPSDYFSLAPIVENPLQAVEQVLQNASKDDTVIVTGSLYLVGEVRKIWHQSVRFTAE